MGNATVYALWILASYLAGGIPFGFLIGKMRGIDVRKAGSGNIGATNVFRCVGRKWGLLAFALDVAKGLAPVAAARAWGGGLQYLPLAAGGAAVAGHMLTPYMKFKGGKGVATAFGMLIGLAPGLVAAAFALFCAVFAVSNYISLASCSAAAFLAVAVWIPVPFCAVHGGLPFKIFVTAVAAFVVWKHRSNIARLANGTENKIYLRHRGGSGAGGATEK
ncbi:MAG: glycerol-3-phosphate 1-O-acyltransferase PlsY [Kiritimatiellae bacterium]|nr:glycerol-3-phosphate 1-O-acyltransferase PlsY [Kiritimatiellia bacterium]